MPELPVKRSMHQRSWHPKDRLWGECKWIAWRQICFTTTHHTHHITQICRNGQVITHASERTHTDTCITVIPMHKYCCYAQMNHITWALSKMHIRMHTSSCVFVYGHKVDFHGDSRIKLNIRTWMDEIVLAAENLQLNHLKFQCC